MSDRILDHHLQQLSALMDGALAPDQARFLLRRLRHDRELAETWERWQIAGQTLRGSQERLLPPDFAARVQARIAAEPPVAAASGHGRRWRAVAGFAAAASLAAVALWLVRPAGESGGDDATPAVAVQAPSAAAPASASSPAAPAPARPAPAEARRTEAVAALAPAREPARRPHTARAPRTEAAPAAVAALQTPPLPEAPIAPQPHDPFALGAQPITPRPWPRATLPQYGNGNGAYAAGFGAQDAPRFDPFAPRLPARPAEDDVDSGTPR